MVGCLSCGEKKSEKGAFAGVAQGLLLLILLLLTLVYK